MKIYFLRHGIAVEPDVWDGSDFDRPLTAEGAARMERESKTIAALDLGLDAVLSSPLVRAKQTAAIVTVRSSPPKTVIEDSRLGAGFNASRLQSILHDHPDVGSILLVGHEPGMSHTVGALTGARVDFKKGCLACVEVPSSQSQRGQLVWLLPPKFLILKGS